MTRAAILTGASELARRSVHDLAERAARLENLATEGIDVDAKLAEVEDDALRVLGYVLWHTEEPDWDLAKALLRELDDDAREWLEAVVLSRAMPSPGGAA